LQLVCGAAAVVGHCYPVWHGFRGGKGAATAVGAYLVVLPWAVLPMLALWLAVLATTGWVALGTMLAAVSVLPLLAWRGAPAPLWWFAGVLAAFIVFTHRSNIRDMLSGAEYRFEKARIRNWFGRR
jgi:glycerol-3-phosphate acyltransferase PlsY